MDLERLHSIFHAQNPMPLQYQIQKPDVDDGATICAVLYIVEGGQTGPLDRDKDREKCPGYRYRM